MHSEPFEPRVLGFRVVISGHLCAILHAGHARRSIKLQEYFWEHRSKTNKKGLKFCNFSGEQEFESDDADTIDRTSTSEDDDSEALIAAVTDAISDKPTASALKRQKTLQQVKYFLNGLLCYKQKMIGF